MAKNRIKLTAPAIRSRAEAEALMREIAEATLARNREQIAMDEAITAARQRHEEALSRLNRELEQKTEVARTWAEANPSEFGALRSIDMVHGVLGWRTGQPALKTLSGWTWDRVLEKLTDAAQLRGYIRTKAEVDKQRMLADREALGADKLREIGVRVVQDEAFYVEPKLAEIENRTTAEAA